MPEGVSCGTEHTVLGTTSYVLAFWQIDMVLRAVGARLVDGHADADVRCLRHAQTKLSQQVVRFSASAQLAVGKLRAHPGMSGELAALGVAVLNLTRQLDELQHLGEEAEDEDE